VGSFLSLIFDRQTPLPTVPFSGLRQRRFHPRPLLSNIILTLFNLLVIGADLANYLANLLDIHLAMEYAINLAIAFSL